MSGPNLNEPFEVFLFAALAEYTATQLPHGGKLSVRLWQEQVARAHEAWHAARKAKKKRSPAFVPPTPEEVTAYSVEINYPIDGVAWCLGYATKGWHTSGSAKMKNWRLAVQKWKREGWKTKHKPDLPPEVIAEAPANWLDWMRINRPGWRLFRLEEEGHPMPAWNRLTKEERIVIVEEMNKAP